MNLSDRTAFRRPKYKTVTLTTGDSAYIRVLTGAERDAFNKWVRDEQANPEPTPDLAVYCAFLVRAISDERGERLYTDSESDTLNTSLDAQTIVELFELSTEYNRIAPGAVEAAKNG